MPLQIFRYLQKCLRDIQLFQQQRGGTYDNSAVSEIVHIKSCLQEHIFIFKYSTVFFFIQRYRNRLQQHLSGIGRLILLQFLIDQPFMCGVFVDKHNSVIVIFYDNICPERLPDIFERLFGLLFGFRLCFLNMCKKVKAFIFFRFEIRMLCFYKFLLRFGLLKLLRQIDLSDIGKINGLFFLYTKCRKFTRFRHKDIFFLFLLRQIHLYACR